MEILENINELGNKLNNNLEYLQNNFLKTNIGQLANTAVDFGLKVLLPDFVENEVIEVKDAFITGGIEDALNKTLENAIELGKKALGINNSDFKSIVQAKDALKEGNYLEGISNTLNFVLEKLEKSNLISSNVSSLIKNGKDIILNNIDSNVENEFEQEIKALGKIEKYIANWEKFYSNKNIDGMNNELNKIEKQMKKILPIENIIKNVNKIENINNLINNSENFDFNNVYLELANQI